MIADPLVKLESVSKEYRLGGAPVHALRDVTLTLGRSELAVVHGRSGSGKTTLLNMIGGLDRPSAGRVEVDGLEVSSLPEQALVEYRRETVAFVFQAFGLIPILSAAENVEIPLRLRRLEPNERAARVRELLHLVDLAPRANHRPQELSGGEQQRVAIARALINRPKVILADEPTGNLDPKTSEVIYDLFLRLQAERGVALLVATHNPDLARKAERGYRLVEGRAREIHGDATAIG